MSPSEILLRIGAALDREYVRQWAERMGLAALLDRALAEAGNPD